MPCPVIELTQQLIRCPSLSPDDAGCQILIIKRLQAMGFNIERINVGDTKNFWAWHGQGKTLAFAGHTDVVPVGNINHWIHPPFEPTICNGVLFGRGSADMKGALAAMIVATERFIHQNPNHKNRLAFLITSDEEASGRNGMVRVVETLMAYDERLDYCLIGEPTSSVVVGDVIKNGRRGSLTCNLTVHGTQGHVAYPHLSDNPIHNMLPMLNELITTQWDYGNDFFSPTSMQIVNLETDVSSSNIIPGDVIIQFNFRFSTAVTDKILKERIKKLLEKYQLRYTIDWLLFGQPFLTKNGRLMDVVINTIKHYNKITPQLLTTGGTSDGRFIMLTGAQIIEFGAVNATIHKINECVNITDLQLLAQMYQSIITQLLIT